MKWGEKKQISPVKKAFHRKWCEGGKVAAHGEEQEKGVREILLPSELGKLATIRTEKLKKESPLSEPQLRR